MFRYNSLGLERVLSKIVHLNLYAFNGTPRYFVRQRDHSMSTNCAGLKIHEPNQSLKILAQFIRTPEAATNRFIMDTYHRPGTRLVHTKESKVVPVCQYF